MMQQSLDLKPIETEHKTEPQQVVPLASLVDNSAAEPTKQPDKSLTFVLADCTKLVEEMANVRAASSLHETLDKGWNLTKYSWLNLPTKFLARPIEQLLYYKRVGAEQENLQRQIQNKGSENNGAAFSKDLYQDLVSAVQNAKSSSEELSYESVVLPSQNNKLLKSSLAKLIYASDRLGSEELCEAARKDFIFQLKANLRNGSLISDKTLNNCIDTFVSTYNENFFDQRRTEEEVAANLKNTTVEIRVANVNSISNDDRGMRLQNKLTSFARAKEFISRHPLAAGIASGILAGAAWNVLARAGWVAGTVLGVAAGGVVGFGVALGVAAVVSAYRRKFAINRDIGAVSRGQIYGLKPESKAGENILNLQASTLFGNVAGEFAKISSLQELVKAKIGEVKNEGIDVDSILENNVRLKVFERDAKELTAHELLFAVKSLLEFQKTGKIDLISFDKEGETAFKQKKDLLDLVRELDSSVSKAIEDLSGYDQSGNLVGFGIYKDKIKSSSDNALLELEGLKNKVITEQHKFASREAKISGATTFVFGAALGGVVYFGRRVLQNIVEYFSSSRSTVVAPTTTATPTATPELTPEPTPAPTEAPVATPESQIQAPTTETPQTDAGEIIQNPNPVPVAPQAKSEELISYSRSSVLRGVNETRVQVYGDGDSTTVIDLRKISSKGSENARGQGFNLREAIRSGKVALYEQVDGKLRKISNIKGFLSRHDQGSEVGEALSGKTSAKRLVLGVESSNGKVKPFSSWAPKAPLTKEISFNFLPSFLPQSAPIQSDVGSNVLDLSSFSTSKNMLLMQMPIASPAMLSGTSELVNEITRVPFDKDTPWFASLALRRPLGRFVSEYQQDIIEETENKEQEGEKEEEKGKEAFFSKVLHGVFEDSFQFVSDYGEVSGYSSQMGRDYQEDGCLALSKDNSLFLVIADGAGGMGGGDVASRIAIDTALKGLEEGLELSAAIEAIGPKIKERSKEGDPRLAQMSTTTTAVEIKENKARFYHAGDSTALIIRSGALIHKTFDHKALGRLFSCFTAMENVDPVGIMTRGDDTFDLEVGDIIIAASDGVWDRFNKDLDTFVKDVSASSNPYEFIKTSLQDIRRQEYDTPNFKRLDNATFLVYQHKKSLNS